MDIFAAADSVACTVMHLGDWPILLLYMPEVPPLSGPAPINGRGRPEIKGPEK